LRNVSDERPREEQRTMTKTLLVVHHTPSPGTRELLEAVLAGARDPDIEGVDIEVLPALAATVPDMLNANGYLFGTTANLGYTTANLGYMSGALKHYLGEYPSTRFRRRSSNAYDLSALRECNAARAIVRGWLRKVVIRPARVLGSRAMPSCMNIETRS
jgi:hypothetical protein